MMVRETRLGMRATRSETARPSGHFCEVVTHLLRPKKDRVPSHAAAIISTGVVTFFSSFRSSDLSQSI